MTKDKILASATALAVSLLVAFEGYSSTPYVDIAGILTDCYGNTHQVSRDRVRSKEECTYLLQTEVGRIGKMLLDDVPSHNVYTLASGISFVYNIGDGAYRSSTYRRRLKAGDFVGACNQMHRWKYITRNGVKVEARGLVNRRAQEVEVCLRGT